MVERSSLIAWTASLLRISAVAWDGSRPVPFRRLFREWLIFAPILVVVLWLMQRDSSGVHRLARSAWSPRCRSTSGFGYVLAKFGYQRRTLADLRTPRASDRAGRHRDVRVPVRARRRRGAPRRWQPSASGSVAEPMTTGDGDVRRRHRRRHDRHPLASDPRRRCGDGVSSYREFPQHFPRPGWVEHDAAEIWDAVRTTLGEVLDRVGAGARRRASGSPTNARRSWRGIARPACRTVGRSSGRTGAPRHAATPSPTLVTSISSASAPGSCSIPTSAARSSSGCSPRAACRSTNASPSARSTRGSCGTSPAGSATSATSPTPAARCCSTSAGCAGTTSSPTCSTSRSPPCPRSSPRRDESARPRSASACRRAFPSAASPATSRRRCSGSPASSPGMAKNTYGTGSFALLNVGSTCPATGRRFAHHRCLDARRRNDGVRPGGGDLRHRCRRAVAARRPRR